MTVALSSLRVTGEFDAAGYVRGAAQKVAADQQMIAADKARNASLAQVDAAMAKVVPGVSKLSASLLDGYSAGSKFDLTIRQIGNAVDRGMGLDRAAVLLDAAYKKFGLTADAAALVEKGFVSITPAVDAANRRYEAHSIVVSRATAETEALAAAQSSQASINARLGIGANDNSARGADVAALGVSLDNLRAKYAPLYSAQREYLATLRDLNSLEARTALTERERAAAITRTKEAFAGQVTAIRASGSETGLAAHQMTNLGYQVNDIVTGLASGQSPFMIIAQQGGQVQQILSSGEGGVTGSLKSIGVSLLGIVTPGRLAFTAVAASVGLATTALISYQGRMQEVQRQLTGMGRASGATVGGIDAIAQQNSSPGGLSTNEARELASVLAATGKVGVDSIGPIVALGHDFAKTFGIDAKEANELLAKSFADPAKGATELNERLGFLDANTKLLIETLVVQGNRTEAVRVLTDKIRGSIANAADVTSFWSRAANAAGNSLSDFFDRVGRGADRMFDGGSGLDEKIRNLTVQLLDLQKAQLEASRAPALAFLGGFDAAEAAKQIADITAKLEDYRKQKLAIDTAASPETRDKQRGLEIDAIARAALPAIENTRKLRDETAALGEAFNNLSIGKYVTLIGTDLVLAYQRKQAAEKASIGADPVRNEIADAEAQIQALDRRSIAARAQFAREAEARRQMLDPNAGSFDERLLKQDQAARLAAGGQTALDAARKTRIGTLGTLPEADEKPNKQPEKESRDDRRQRRMPAAA
jgi:hypothetical protein